MKNSILLILLLTIGSSFAQENEIICDLNEMKNVSIFILQDDRGTPLRITMLDNSDQSREFEEFSDVIGSQNPTLFYTGKTTTSAYFKKGSVVEIKIDEETGEAKIKVRKTSHFTKKLAATCKI